MPTTEDLLPGWTWAEFASRLIDDHLFNIESLLNWFNNNTIWMTWCNKINIWLRVFRHSLRKDAQEACHCLTSLSGPSLIDCQWRQPRSSKGSRDTRLSWTPPELYKKYVEDFLHGFLTADVIEGSFTDQKLIGENSQAPQIDGVVVFNSLQNLRRSIVECTTISFSSVITDGRPSEIA